MVHSVKNDQISQARTSELWNCEAPTKHNFASSLFRLRHFIPALCIFQLNLRSYRLMKITSKKMPQSCIKETALKPKLCRDQRGGKNEKLELD